MISLNAFSTLAIEGCYLLPSGSPDFLCQSVEEADAEADYLDIVGDTNNFNAFFIPGSSNCETEFPDICAPVTCSTSCATESIAACEEQGGQAIPDGEFNQWCSAGCCTVGNFCNFVSTRQECIQQAANQGVNFDPSNYISSDTGEVDATYCLQEICLLDLQDAQLSGFVSAEDGSPINDARVQLTSENFDLTEDGAYSISISPGSYVVQVTANGFASASETVTLTSGETEIKDFVLSEAGDFVEVSGTVFDEAGETVSSVSVCWQGVSIGCTTSNNQGQYTATELVVGDYTFTLSRIGFTTTQESFTVSGDDPNKNLVIEASTRGSVSGVTHLDITDNGESDGEQYGVSIFANGIYKGSSSFPGADFDIELEPGTYTITASYQDFSSDEHEVSLVQGSSVDLGVLLLTREIGECSFDGPNNDKPVASLSAQAVQGAPDVLLNWPKPCPEVSVYNLYRDGELLEVLSPFDISYVDEDLEWGATHSYEIEAIYGDGPTTRPSREKTGATITLGDAACERKSVGEFFCLLDQRQGIFACDASNNLQTSSDCGNLGDSWFCSEPSPGTAICKDAGMCSAGPLLAQPFGLYFEESSCYGNFLGENEGYENFCFFDYTSGVSNQCDSCAEVESCFNYKSEGACQVNNCLGQSCEWVEATTSTGEGPVDDLNTPFTDEGYLFPITEQTGHGYCIEPEYEEDKFCNLCGSDAPLLENNFCTPEVCTDLGACFSEEDLTQCNTCGEESSVIANCYTYNSELECTNGQDTSNNNGEILHSGDSCGWGACRWLPDEATLSGGSCVKDGDADLRDDCLTFGAGERATCEIDTNAPSTVVVTDDLTSISTIAGEVTFRAIDPEENPLGELFYCIDASDAPICNNFVSKEFFGIGFDQEIQIDLIGSQFLEGEIIDGETYRLRFFSKDKYFNQESVQEAFIFVDNEVPEFTIAKNVNTVGDTSTLQIFLTDLNEAMSCDFDLQQILPSGSTLSASVGRNDDKEHLFENLQGVRYDLSVTCADDHGNENTKDESIIFDLEQDITLINPAFEGAVDTTSIAFEVSTEVSASCSLYLQDEASLAYSFVADFRTTDAENKNHITDPIGGFFEGEYPGTVKVVCQESFTSEILEDYFNFMVDFTAPETQIILKEGNREEKPTTYGWEEFFVDIVEVDFLCNAEGFDCEETFYCLGPDCTYAAAPGYQAYTENVILNDTTEICYYSTDTGSSISFPTCGKIKVEGFGINLIQPEGFSFEGELWGVSNEQIFDWEVRSRLDTESCKFDFAPGFDYDLQPLYKTFEFSDNGENFYLYDSFPGEVLPPYQNNGGVKILHVQCEDVFGELGPTQKMKLEYDPSAPVIRRAHAEPDFVTEAIETSIFVETDDKTTCRYSDNSDGDGSTDFDTMEFTFPGGDEGQYNIEHSDRFRFSFTGAEKEFSLNVQCKNGAGDLSEVEQIDFTVDYSVSGNIVSLAPSGFVGGADISLEAGTNKNAICNYDGIEFASTGSTSHSEFLGTLEEDDYHYLVSCQISGDVRTGEIIFTVDNTAPTVTSVDDGTFSCSLESTTFRVYTDEPNISHYSYELYKGKPERQSDRLKEFFNSSNVSTGSSRAATLISSGVLSASEELIITGVQFVEGQDYFIKAAATDAAGNIGFLGSSDGFVASTDNLTECASDEDAPGVSLKTENSCTAVEVELYCDDLSSCQNMVFGQSGSSASCVPTSSYTGNKISFDKSGWVCYSATDAQGNEKNSTQQVLFVDSDGDGFANSCDLCSGTIAGSDVDSDGCASGQVPDGTGQEDRDADGLPDRWEGLFNTVECPLNPDLEDSDGNGIVDTEEDYDNDGFTNLEEYRSNLDPCVYDEVAALEESGFEFTPSTGGSESNLVAWILFILGIILFFGAGGYLIYFYQKDPRGKAILSGRRVRATGPVSASAPSLGRRVSPRAAVPAQPKSYDKNLASLRRGRRKKRRSLEKESLFGSFSKKSNGLPHFKDILSSRKSHHAKVEAMVDRYQEHKKTIRPGLRPKEKALFSRLDAIAKETSKKKVSVKEVVDKGEAKDIFAKLKEISKKRKNGGQ